MNLAQILMSFVSATAAAGVAEQPQRTQPPEAFSRVTACRSVTTAAERLACYDREVAALAAAEQSQQVVIVDQAQIKQTQRGLFGLRLPNIGRLFDHEAGPREITAKLAGAAINSSGRWTFTLDDGSTWSAIESRQFSRDPRAGMEIRIRQAALGSYMANIGSQRAVRVTRVR